MEIEITRKDAKPLLKRTEVEARITFQGATPTRQGVLAAVSKAMQAKQELVIIRKIDTAYGEQSARVLGYVYEDRQSLEGLELGYALKRNTFEKEKPEGEAAEAPKEEKKEEKPETPKEEAKEKKEEATPEQKEEPKAEEKPEASKEEKPEEKKDEAAPEKPAEGKKEEKAKPAEKPADEKKGGDE